MFLGVSVFDRNWPRITWILRMFLASDYPSRHIRLCRNVVSKTYGFVRRLDFSDILVELIRISSCDADDNSISPFFQQRHSYSAILTGEFFNQPANTNNIYHTDNIKTSTQQRHLSFDTIKTT